MDIGTHWISKGALVSLPTDIAINERDLLHREGYIKIVEDHKGTTVKWAMFTPNWASLYFSMEWIHRCLGPYHLYYHSAGWFHEKYDTATEAAERMAQLVCKSDVHLSRTVYIYEASENRTDVPSLLKAALHDNAADEEHSIDCLYDSSSK